MNQVKAFKSSGALKTLCVGLVALGLGFEVRASQIVHEVFKGHAVEASSRKARLEILKQTRLQVLSQKAEQMLGRKLKPEEAEALAEKSGLYILREKVGRLKSPRAGEFEAQVQMDVNLQALRTQLLKQGLFYQFKHKPRVLVAVSFIDYIGGNSFSWWQDAPHKNNALLRELTKSLNGALVEQFQNANTFQLVLQPQPMSEQRKQASPQSRKNLFQLAKKNKAQILLQGRVVLQNLSGVKGRGVGFSSSGGATKNQKQKALPAGSAQLGSSQLSGPQLKSHFDLFFVGEQKLEGLTEIRQLDTLKNYKALRVEFAKLKNTLAEKATQALEKLWQQGDLGTMKFVIKVRHNLNAVDLESFKKLLSLRVPSLKQLKERFIYNQVVGFEARSFLTAQATASQIQPATLLPFKMRLKSVSENLIELRVER